MTAIMSKISNKIKVTYQSEMARNAIESEFRTSKLGAGGHFGLKLHKKKVAYQSEMARNVIESDFRTSKMAVGGHFAKNYKKSLRSVWIRNDQKCNQK